MANNIKLTNAGNRTIDLDTTGVVNVGDGSNATISTMILQISGTFAGSLVLRKKARGSVLANASALTTWYEDHAVGTTAVAAGTAIAAANTTRLLKVYVDGCDLILDYTATSGTMLVEVIPLNG